MEQAALEEIALDLYTTFTKFTFRPRAFRDMMRQTGSIITGSTALHFLLRHPSHWTPGHVDIIAPKGEFEAVLQHIMTETGAHLKKSVNASQLGQDLDKKTGTVRLVSVETLFAKFTVRESATRSPFHPLPFHWATHLMNALTADACICAYPSLTLRNKTLITNKEYAYVTRESQRYRILGFTVFERARDLADVSDSCSDLLVCGKRERMIGDRHTLVVPAGGKNLRRTLTALGEGSTTCWKLGGEHCKNKVCFMRGRREVDTSYWVYNRVLSM